MLPWPLLACVSHLRGISVSGVLLCSFLPLVLHGKQPASVQADRVFELSPGILSLSLCLGCLFSFRSSFSTALEYFFTEISREAVAINDHWSCSTGGYLATSSCTRRTASGRQDASQSAKFLGPGGGGLSDNSRYTEGTRRAGRGGGGGGGRTMSHSQSMPALRKASAPYGGGNRMPSRTTGGLSFAGGGKGVVLPREANEDE